MGQWKWKLVSCEKRPNCGNIEAEHSVQAKKTKQKNWLAFENKELILCVLCLTLG